MILVRSNQNATLPIHVGGIPLSNNWKAGTVQSVDDELLSLYQSHPDVFTIISEDGPLTTGVEAVAGLSANNVMQNLIQQVTFTLTDVSIAVTDALAYASKKLFTFPEGRIEVLGVLGSLQFAVTTDRATTINDSASLTWALGSVAASNITLSSTMVDMLPKTVKVLDGVAAAYTTASKTALVASTQLDGTTTPVPVFLNVGFEDNTAIDANGTLTVKGSLTLTYLNLGDL